MKVEHTNHGSAIIDHTTKTKLIHVWDTPGNYLWIGDTVHLNRDEVMEMVHHLLAWVKTGSLELKPSVTIALTANSGRRWLTQYSGTLEGAKKAFVGKKFIVKDFFFTPDNGNTENVTIDKVEFVKNEEYDSSQMLYTMKGFIGGENPS